MLKQFLFTLSITTILNNAYPVYGNPRDLIDQDYSLHYGRILPRGGPFQGRILPRGDIPQHTNEGNPVNRVQTPITDSISLGRILPRGGPFQGRILPRGDIPQHTNQGPQRRPFLSPPLVEELSAPESLRRTVVLEEQQPVNFIPITPRLEAEGGLSGVSSSSTPPPIQRKNSREVTPTPLTPEISEEKKLSPMPLIQKNVGPEIKEVEVEKENIGDKRDVTKRRKSFSSILDTMGKNLDIIRLKSLSAPSSFLSKDFEEALKENEGTQTSTLPQVHKEKSKEITPKEIEKMQSTSLTHGGLSQEEEAPKQLTKKEAHKVFSKLFFVFNVLVTDFFSILEKNPRLEGVENDMKNLDSLMNEINKIVHSTDTEGPSDSPYLIKKKTFQHVSQNQPKSKGELKGSKKEKKDFSSLQEAIMSAQPVLQSLTLMSSNITSDLLISEEAARIIEYLKTSEKEITRIFTSLDYDDQTNTLRKKKNIE